MRPDEHAVHGGRRLDITDAAGDDMPIIVQHGGDAIAASEILETL